MQVVLYPKVLSDIDSILQYYEEMATPELAREFYVEFRHLLVQAAERPESFSARAGDIRRLDLRRSLITFCFAFGMMSCGFSSFVITADVHHLGTSRR